MPTWFRSDAQRNEVCSTLCWWSGHGPLWSLWPGSGPAERAIRLLSGELTAHAAAEVSVARIAVALWEGRGELRFGDLLADLEPEARRAVDGLLEALLESPSALDAWIEEHGREGNDADSLSAQRARELRHTGTL